MRQREARLDRRAAREPQGSAAPREDGTPREDGMPREGVRPNGGGTPREVELKLELDPGDVPALLAHPLLADPAAPPRILRSVYYDTEDRRLAAAGLSLRVRARDDGTVQTVKADTGTAGGLFDRGEWETPVEGPRPSGRALKGTPAREVLGPGGAKRLRPLFTTIVARSERVVRIGTARVLVSVDEGRVEAGEGRTLPLCEVELELKEGDPADLFALARILAERASLRPGALAKSERGYALVDGTLDAAAKADPVALPRRPTTAAGFQAVARACLRHLHHNERAFLQTRRPETLHQTRVALRRLRAALALFQEVVADDRLAALKAELKRLTAPLGRARDLDVFSQTTLAAEIARRPDEPGLPDLAVRVEAERSRAYDAVAALLRGAEWRGFMLDLAAWVETGPWLMDADGLSRRDRPLRAFARGQLARLRRKVSRHRHLARLDPPARHRVRIAAKRLRYAAEFLEGLDPKGRKRRRHAAFVAALADLQEELGALNDVATGHALAAEIVASLPPAVKRAGTRASLAVAPATLFAAGVVAADQDGRTDALLVRAERAHAAFRDARRFWR